ncbi:MAG: phosphodiester glycosidase family protein [Ktedonobacteraceae bacterium]
MLPKNFYKLCLLFILLSGTLLACSLSSTATFNNGTPVVSTTPPPAGTPTLNQWITASPGVEMRYEDWKSPGNNEDTVTIVRFDLNKVHLKVGYQPSKPLAIDEWMSQEQATAIINGGYFDQNNATTALVVSNGQAYGTSYNGFGGMLSIDTQGNISLRSLKQQPYDPNNEQLQQATQSSPMLMINGKRTQFNANAASQRRSIVAQDTQGRLLFIASPGSAFSLDELADILAASDLSIKTALNLDGGASTGLYVNAGNQHVAIDAVTTLPIVIIVK